MHVWSGYPLYTVEAYQRWHFYPPPYWTGSYWAYATPWLWIDGDPHSGWYTQWESKVVARLAIPAPVTITMGGWYSPSYGGGGISATFRNDSTETLSGHVLFVITEDDLHVQMGNGDTIHNHVARDYLPNHIGVAVSIPAGDSVTVSQPFTINPGWNEDNITIITWFQDDVLQPDSVKEIWQGGMKDLSEFGIEEVPAEDIHVQDVLAAPNPCVNSTNFSFSLPAGVEYGINIFDVTGRHVKTLSGLSSGNQEVVAWNLKDDRGFVVGAGVYLFRFESNVVNTNGKIVVR